MSRGFPVRAEECNKMIESMQNLAFRACKSCVSHNHKRSTLTVMMHLEHQGLTLREYAIHPIVKAICPHYRLRH